MNQSSKSGHDQPLHPAYKTMRMIEEAFARFGSAFLWNVRHPDRLEPNEDPLVYAEHVGRRLERSGNAEARIFAANLLQEVAYAKPIPVRDHGDTGLQPQ